MVSRGEDYFVIWPIYFDKSVSRIGGRKVPKKYAVDKPNISSIEKAAKSLGLKPKVEKNSIHPSKPWKKSGRILIEKKESKNKLLKKIAQKI